MKVLHLLKTEEGAIWAFRQIKSLVEFGVKSYVVLPKGSSGRAEKYKKIGAIPIEEIISFPITRIYNLPNVLKELRRIVSYVKPDIIHSYFVSTTLVMRLALGEKHHIPRIFQVAGPLHLEYWPYRIWDAKTIGSQDYIIATCRLTEKIYLEKIRAPKERVFMSYYGTEIKGFSCRKTGKLRKELRLSNHVPLIGMIAYMYPPKYYLGQRFGLKGHETFIKAIALLKEKTINISGVIIGGQWGKGNWYENRLKRIARKKCRNVISFLGTRNDISELYSDIDIAVHPSWSENVGGAVESLLSGVSTIASNVGGLPDMIIDGKTGLLIEPGNFKALAKSIEFFLKNKDEAKKMVTQGKELVEKHFDIKKTSREVFEIYNKILSY